jgi:hypothetical protein
VGRADGAGRIEERDSTTGPLEAIRHSLSTLSLEDLERVKQVLRNEMLARRLREGGPRTGNEIVRVVRLGDREFKLQYRRCTTATCQCSTSGRGHGPYWTEYWKDDNGERKFKYHGKEQPFSDDALEPWHHVVPPISAQPLTSGDDYSQVRTPSTPPLRTSSARSRSRKRE